MSVGLEVALDSFQAFLVVIVVLDWRYIVIGEVVAVLGLEVGVVLDHDEVLLALLGVFIEDLVVHSDEVEGLAGEVDTLLVLLDVAGHFLRLFLETRLSLVLVLLQDLLLALRRVLVDGRVCPQLLLVESHHVLVSRNVLLEEGVFLSDNRATGLHSFRRLLLENSTLLRISGIFVHFLREVFCVFLQLHQF